MAVKIWRGTLLLAALGVTSVAAADSAPQPDLGGKLFYSGGEIKVEVLPAEAGYTSELGLYKGPNAGQLKAMIATNRQQGTIRTITAVELKAWGLRPGDELIFGIHVIDTNETYFVGDGTRNPDGLAHAMVTVTGATTAKVGFEDLFGGGDRDYDDNVFGFTGGISSRPEPPTTANRPPDCSHVKPSVSELWPPNHKMISVSILGCIDPDKDPSTIEILKVTQDEPVRAKHHDNTSPDAVIEPGGKVQLRAERRGNEGTRVYNVTFVAKDSKGASSPETTVSVAVPKSQGEETHPKGTRRYDSTAAR